MSEQPQCPDSNMIQNGELNYRNTATQVHPLIVQMYRCELDEDDDDKTEKEKEKKVEEQQQQREKTPPDPIYRANEHNVQASEMVRKCEICCVPNSV